MPTEPDAPAAYENPLIPNARLRRIYTVVLQARLLGDSLRPSQRRLTRGLEAALVSTAVDLAAHDLISDTIASPVIDLLRATTFTPPPPSLPPLKPSQQAVIAAWAAPATLPPTTAIADRIATALGAAAALKSASAKSKSYVKAKGGNTRQPGVVLTYVHPGEVSTALWRTSLAFAAAHELPILFVVLPPATRPSRTPAHPARLNPIVATALRNTVPGITVDANDPIALYRVAQECIGRARMGGGPALIDCVPFLIHGARTAPEDALIALERYLLQRSVATRAWMDREANTFTRRLASKKK